MKQRGAIYDENSITYWPNYTTVLGCMYLCSLMGAGFAVIAIVQILLPGVNNIVLPVLALVLSISCFCITVKINGFKEKKVVIDANGITIFPKHPFEIFHISWEEVSEIKYEYQLWYGLESLRVTYKKAIATGPVEDSKYDYLRLSLRSVEQGKITELIPRSIPFV